MRILVSGDSYATRDIHYELFPIWPEILSEKFNATLTNVSRCGLGNDAIYNNAIDFLVQKSYDLVVMMWTKIYRLSTEKKISEYKVEAREIKDGNDVVMFYQTLRYIYSIQLICAALKIPIVNVGGTEIVYEETFTIGHSFINSPIADKLNTNNFIGWPFLKCFNGFCLGHLLEDDERIGNGDKHPNKKGHQKMAKIIYDFILKNKTI